MPQTALAFGSLLGSGQGGAGTVPHLMDCFAAHGSEQELRDSCLVRISMISSSTPSSNGLMTCDDLQLTCS